MCDQHLSDDERGARPGGPVGFVDELVVAITNSRIYSKGHPRVQSAVQNLARGFEALCREGGGGRVELGSADGLLFHARRPLLGASLSARRLIEQLSALESGGIGFDRSTTHDDLETLATFMSRGCPGAKRHTDANLALAERGCTRIHFLPPYREAGGTVQTGEVGETVPFAAEVDLDSTAPELSVSRKLYQDVVHVLQDSMVKSCRGESLEPREAGAFIGSILEGLNDDTQSMMRLARYERYDAFTFGHSIRVCFIALNFARHLTQDRALLQRIGIAALLHDIGKAWVPFEVLHSQGRLSDAERREMNLHPLHGGQLLLQSKDPDPLPVAVAFGHHQNHDGTGYPTSVRPVRQSTATMLVKLSDVFEALTAVRPYKPRMSPTRAYRIMMSMEGHFEPSLLRKFISVNGVYPVGSRVRLDTGEVARVKSQTDSLVAPVVRTETASRGEALFAEDVTDIDLSRPTGKRKPKVEALLLDAEM